MGFAKRLLIFFIIILALALLSIFYPYFTGKAVSENQYQKEPAFVLRVIDGDTIEVEINKSTQKVRLLGINTPEKNKPYYKEALNFLKHEIENKSIEVLRDKTDIDKYDRKLRYVFYDERLINLEILQEGLATIFMADELKYKDKLIDGEKFAKKNELGLWKKSTDICTECISLAKLEPIQEFFTIKNYCSFSCNLSGWFVKDDANHFFYLSQINPDEEKTYNSKGEIWNNDNDRFFMRDKKGYLVIFYEY